MKLVWHLFRKDLGRVKIFASALFLLVALRPLLGVIAIAKNDFTYRDAIRFENIDSLLLLGHVIGAWLLTLWLAQLDSPRRPDAFLHTRPVSRRALWSAKLLGALALCAFAPLLIWFPWWLGCGMTGSTLRALIVGHVAGLTLIVIPAFTFGTLVRDYRRGVLCSIVFAIVAVCLYVLFSYPGESPRHHLANRDWILRTIVWVLFGLSATLALLGLLYRRHPRWTDFTAWAAATVVLGVTCHRTHLPAARPVVWREHNAAAFADLQIDSTSLKRHTSSHSGPAEKTLYTMRARATGTDGFLLPHTEIETISFTAQDGASVSFKDDFLWSYDADDLAPLFALPPEPTRDASRAPKTLGRVWDREQAVRLDTLSGPLTVRADLRITLRRPVLVSRQPLEPSGWHRGDGIGYRICFVQNATGPYPGIELKMVQTELDSSGSWMLWQWLDRQRDHLVHRVGAFDAQGRSVLDSSTQNSARYTVAGVKVTHIIDSLHMPWIKAPDGKWTTPTPTPEWRAGLSYAAINLEPVARLRRELIATDVAIERQK